MEFERGIREGPNLHKRSGASSSGETRGTQYIVSDPNSPIAIQWPPLPSAPAAVGRRVVARSRPQPHAGPLHQFPAETTLECWWGVHWECVVAIGRESLASQAT